MATGYTSSITDKSTFNDFAMTCARAFGACITLRDESLNPDIPEMQPNDYYLKALEEAKKELSQLAEMSDLEAQCIIDEEYLSEKTCFEEIIKEKIKLRKNYERILNQAKDWCPPTDDHIDLKSFMLQQLHDSIENDCSSIDLYQKELLELSVSTKDAGKWRKEKYAKLTQDLEYYEKEYAEEVERTNKRNSWVNAIKASLPGITISNVPSCDGEKHYFMFHSTSVPDGHDCLCGETKYRNENVIKKEE